MAKPQINQVYVSITRGFQFNPRESALNSNFKFLGDIPSFYDQVIGDINYLGSQSDLSLPDLGQVRSVLDVDSTSISNNALGCQPDNVFIEFQEYYSNLCAKGHLLLPHYPCVIDILPSQSAKYLVNKDKFPGSISQVEVLKLSLSARIYPAGLVSLRFGLFLLTRENFEVRDLTDLLWRKTGSIDIEGLGSNLSIDKITRIYGQKLLNQLCKKHTPLSWSFTYSSVDIIDSTLLTLQGNYENVFSPLINLGRTPRDESLIPINQSRENDIVLFGPKSCVLYLNSADWYGRMNPDRRKLRRWIRNSIELFSAQQLISNCISADTIARIFDSLKADRWIEILKKGIMPPAINQLFSYWNYTNLHLQNYPMIKQDWRTRHCELMRILDANDRIAKANKISMKQLIDISKEANKAQKDLGNAIKSLPAIIKDYKSALTF